MTDFFARRKEDDRVTTNIGELLRNDDKIKVMRLLGCEEKYINGACSDYEFFAEWERVVPLCAGTGAAVVYGEERVLLGLSETDSPADAWRGGNDFLAEHVSDFKKKEKISPILDLNRIVSDFAKRSGRAFSKYDALRQEFCDILIAEKSNPIHSTVFLTSFEFQRPDPYHASLFLEKRNAEKWNDEKEAVLLLQLLIDGLTITKKYKKDLVLHLHTREDAVADAAISYLLDRSLTEGQIRLGVSSRIDPEALVSRMDRWGGKQVTPELVLNVGDLDEGLEDRLYDLFCVYPAGGLRFGGILTDAPLIEAYHRSFDRRFRAALARFCLKEELIGQISRQFYSV